MGTPGYFLILLCYVTSEFGLDIPYSGKFSNGANFRIIRKHATCAKIKTFENLFWTHVSKKEVERVCGRFEDGTLSFLYEASP